MNVEQVKEYLHNIESKTYSYSDLLQYDCLFEVKGRWPDDNDLIDTFYKLDHAKFVAWQKLRGARDTIYPKLADNTNNTNYCHGYIIFTDNNNTKDVEKDLIFASLKGNISVKKIHVGLIEIDLKQRQEEHFNSLFSLA